MMRREREGGRVKHSIWLFFFIFSVVCSFVSRRSHINHMTRLCIETRISPSNRYELWLWLWHTHTRKQIHKSGIIENPNVETMEFHHFSKNYWRIYVCRVCAMYFSLCFVCSFDILIKYRQFFERYFFSLHFSSLKMWIMVIWARNSRMQKAKWFNWFHSQKILLNSILPSAQSCRRISNLRRIVEASNVLSKLIDCVLCCIPPMQEQKIVFLLALFQ